ncbi:MAG: DUF58 domain-containing protein [Candidatus Babeliales bacterium]
MNRSEILQKARLITVQTRRVLNSLLVGDFRTRARGTGFEFDQLSEYQLGSDIRFVDWKSSARMSKLLVKEFRQERSRHVTVVLDVSASNEYGSGSHAKQEFMHTIAGVLAMAGIYARDIVSLLLYTDRVEQYVRPGRGMVHGYYVLEQLLSAQPVGKKSELRVAIDHLMHVQKQPSIVFIISDGIDETLESIRMLTQRHEVIFVRCLDALEKHIGQSGALMLQDLETDLLYQSYDTVALQAYITQRLKQQEQLFQRYAVGMVDVNPTLTVEQFAHVLRLKQVHL